VHVLISIITAQNVVVTIHYSWKSC